MARIACIGTGTVGSAWAVVFARAGHEVMLFDSEPAQAARALTVIRRMLDDLGAAGHLAEGAAAVMTRIHSAPSLAAAVEGAAHVQESVREDVAVKRQVLAGIARHAPAEAVLASSTSALPGSSFLGDIDGPERALVVHPVNPPALIPLVEICGTDRTAADTVERTRAFMESLGMRPVVLRREIAGFLLNRLQYTLVAEAMHLVGEGYCTAEEIDIVMTQGLALRWLSVGPFATAHLNAADGFAGFVARLGPMMRRMGAEARTTYPWTEQQAAAIHAELCRRMPVEALPLWQAWRDRRILAARRLQEEKDEP